MAEPPDRLELDYTMSADMFRALSDIRFRLLALVPSIAGVTLAVLGDGRPETQLGVGLLGFVATVGVLVYELRNSQLYNWSVHRAKYLERQLGLPSSAFGAPHGGVFSERPRARYRLARSLRVKHDNGLALVYGAALGGWVWLVARGALALLSDLPDRSAFWIALAAAAAGGAGAVAVVIHHDTHQLMPVAVDDAAAMRDALQAACRALDRPARLPNETLARLARSATLLEQVSGLPIAHTDALAPAVAALRRAIERSAGAR